jgi:hypothetical protein
MGGSFRHPSCSHPMRKTAASTTSEVYDPQNEEWPLGDGTFNAPFDRIGFDVVTDQVLIDVNFIDGLIATKMAKLDRIV